MGNNRDGLMAHKYKENVFIRLRDANDSVGEGEDHVFVKLGEEIFPIHKDMVDIYYASGRGFKRGMKKRYIKMLKKHKKQTDGE